MKKSQIGKFYQFKFPGRKEEVYGIVINFNSEWTLIKRAYDYSTDGFFLFKNDKVEVLKGEHEKFADKVFKLMKYSTLKESKIPMDSLDTILTYISKRYKLIGIDTKDGRGFDVVKYIGLKDGLYHCHELTRMAKWRYKLQLPEKEIRYIGFDSDYLNALKLVVKL